MSFILDALRKSENERQRNTTPGIADAPIRQRSVKRSIWLPLVALLLGINLSLLAVLWFVNSRDDMPPPAATVSPAADALPGPARVRDAIRPAADPNVSRELAPELEPAPTVPPMAARPPAATPAPAPKASPIPAAVLDVPTLAELALDGSIALPTLHLDIHVYSDTPAERFVFINTSKYREGEKISEGPVIDEINQLGVILMYENRRFLLTRD